MSMIFRLKFMPPANKGDFESVLVGLERRSEKPQKNANSSVIRKTLINDKRFSRIAFKALTSPVFNTWCERTLQIWKVIGIDRENLEITYEYDTQPVSLDVIASLLKMGKIVNRHVVDDFFQIITDSHKEMFMKGAQEVGLDDKAVQFRRVY